MIEFATRDLFGITVIEATGRLDALASAQLDAALRKAADDGGTRLLVDFGAVAYISSSCLRVLLLGARRARKVGGDLKLCCLAPRVRAVFELAGFDSFFDLFETSADGVAGFALSPNGPRRGDGGA